MTIGRAIARALGAMIGDVLGELERGGRQTLAEKRRANAARPPHLRRFNEVCDFHPRSGRTERGECLGCLRRGRET